MAKLKAAKRKRLKKSSFALKGQRKYPIHDRKHAANALARVSQHGSSAQKKRVKAAVCKKYPGMASCKRRKK